jgi:predicted GNAT superfamily acetyltransferase
MYGDTGSALHEGIGTDRLIATWDIASERVGSCLEGKKPQPSRVDHRIEIPADIHALKRTDPTAAREWRTRTREQFLEYFPDYFVTGFVREGDRGYYELTSTSLAT